MIPDVLHEYLLKLSLFWPFIASSASSGFLWNKISIVETFLATILKSLIDKQKCTNKLRTVITWSEIYF